MKLSGILPSCALALTSAISCAAAPLNDTVGLDHFPPFYPDVSSLDDQPVSDPIEFVPCGGYGNDTAGFRIGQIVFSPNLPVQGQELNISLKGDLSQQLGEGAKVRLKIWKWRTVFQSLDFDWCANVGQPCPVQAKVPVTWFRTQNINIKFPAWEYGLSFETFNPKGKIISCVVMATRVVKPPKGP